MVISRRIRRRVCKEAFNCSKLRSGSWFSSDDCRAGKLHRGRRSQPCCGNSHSAKRKRLLDQTGIFPGFWSALETDDRNRGHRRQRHRFSRAVRPKFTLTERLKVQLLDADDDTQGEDPMYLVTGGAGFIGSHLVDALLE